LRNLFGENINLFNNFFDISEKYNSFFDVIVGNPPYNYGKIKTPTNKELNKKDEGKSIWQKFIIESLKLLKYGGFLSLIVPAIWYLFFIN
jgi:tRNA1(Val) A37 N6-methylase TrmN6